MNLKSRLSFLQSAELVEIDNVLTDIAKGNESKTNVKQFVTSTTLTSLASAASINTPNAITTLPTTYESTILSANVESTSVITEPNKTTSVGSITEENVSNSGTVTSMTEASIKLKLKYDETKTTLTVPTEGISSIAEDSGSKTEAIDSTTEATNTTDEAAIPNTEPSSSVTKIDITTTLDDTGTTEATISTIEATIPKTEPNTITTEINTIINGGDVTISAATTSAIEEVTSTTEFGNSVTDATHNLESTLITTTATLKTTTDPEEVLVP